MSQLSHLAETLIGSEIIRLNGEIKQLTAKGEYIYNYTIGDFDPQIFPIPAALKEEIIRAYNNDFTNYPPADGVAELRQAVAAFVRKHQGIEYAPNEVLIASGGRPLIYSLFRTIVDAGDKVVFAVPSWNNNHYTHMCGGKQCIIETTPEYNFMPRVEDIAPHLDDATLLCICTPQNPTGTMMEQNDLEQICDLVLAENKKRGDGQKKLYIMFDQMYGMICFDKLHTDPVALRPEMKAYTIFIDGISKVFAATGVRVGWALGPVKVIDKMKLLLGHIGAWSPMPEQKATAVFLQNEAAVDAFLANFRKEIFYRLQTIYEGFKALKEKGFAVDVVSPQAAIYLTVQLNLVGKKFGDKVLETQADVTSFLLSEAKLALVPFYAFGAPKTSSWYRLSVGTAKKEEIREMFAKLEGVLRERE